MAYTLAFGKDGTFVVESEKEKEKEDE